ncbi:MAG: hypothetical protein FWC68_04530, partial [Oscillospiraceae bacterium]|nr:hypothetical protein [Oscillospiraceae bacterium]
MLKTKLTEIIDDFFAIGGNHDLEKYKEIRKKLLDFIRDEELFLNADDPNYILAIDTIRFIDA